MTIEEKYLFLWVCRQVCPCFTIRPAMKGVLNDLVRWALGLEGKYDPSKGLWLWGDIGTGKSTMLEIIRRFGALVRPAQRYRDPVCPGVLRREKTEYGFRISNAAYVAGVFARGGYPALEEYILNCRQAFDELGRENTSMGYYGNCENVFQYILQRRYDLRYGDFTHVTSNLSPEQIGQVYGDHIWDRCLEMFNFVEMSGSTWRS